MAAMSKNKGRAKNRAPLDSRAEEKLRRCSVCGQMLPYSAFNRHNDPQRKLKLQRYCRECFSAYLRKRNHIMRVALMEYRRKYGTQGAELADKDNPPPELVAEYREWLGGRNG